MQCHLLSSQKCPVNPVWHTQCWPLVLDSHTPRPLQGATAAAAAGRSELSLCRGEQPSAKREGGGAPQGLIYRMASNELRAHAEWAERIYDLV